jgi:hypothetical protein
MELKIPEDIPNNRPSTTIRLTRLRFNSSTPAEDATANTSRSPERLVKKTSKPNETNNE